MNKFMQIASKEQFEIFFNHRERVTKLIGEEKTMLFINNLLENGALRLLNEMSDQQIIRNGFDISQPQNKAQMREIEKNKKSEEMKKNPQTQKKSQNSQNPQNKKQESEPQRLKRELTQYLKLNKAFTSLKQDNLENFLTEIQNYLKSSTLSQTEISSETTKVKGVIPKKSNIFQFIRIVDSALYLSSNRFRLREMQILALIIFLVGGSQRMLLEILTGQGKSTTISCLAAILAISGYTVDIVTTNELLAKRDVEQKMKFYSLLGLKIDDNFQQNQSGEKKCYNCQVVYGIPHTFQVDILLNDYKKRGTRCNRPYHVLIVDEVDSMFVDQKDHQTLLSQVYPGFSELFYPMQIIWNKINMNPVFKKENRLKMALAMGKDQTTVGDVKVIMDEVIKSIRQKFKNEIIPQWRMEFVELSLQQWIDSAIIAAFVYQEKKHYLVKNSTIVPIDYKNNGSLQQNVQWQNGLHQFLQIKHGLSVTTEGLTSNFISNLGHFDKYTQLYGLTGTLGSDESKLFLKQTYNVDLFKIPPSKKRRLEINPGQILYNNEEWANYIADQIAIMIACERSVLVLCESIQEVDLIKIALDSKKIDFKRIQLLRTGDQKIDDKINTQEVVLATNLAGRGTDLKIETKLNERGGLHVIIGFMPINQRVQMQGRGRAGRNGYFGSSQLAVNYEKYCKQFGFNCQPKIIFENTKLCQPAFMCLQRNMVQKIRMKQDQKTVQDLRAKDRMFDIYCKAMNQIPDFQTNTAKQKALEEKWAMFLKKADILKIPYHTLENEARNLTEKLKNSKESELFNPNYQIERGINQYLKNNKKQAIAHFEAAQKNDASIMVKIVGKLYSQTMKFNETNDRNEKEACINNLSNVQLLIEQRKNIQKGFRLSNYQSQRITQFHSQNLKNMERQFQKTMNQNDDDLLSGKSNDISHMNRSFNTNQNQNLLKNLNSISTGEDRILDGLSKTIQDMKQKFKNLKQNQQLVINFEKMSKILDLIEGDEMQNKKAQQAMSSGYGAYLYPQASIRVKQVPWWKRITVFLLGVAQIVIGAIITASTAGAFANFGVTMMMEGAKYCFDSIFRPQLLKDLGKYLTETAIKYAFALTICGLDVIKKLGTLLQKGFETFQNMPLGKFIKTSLEQVGVGLKQVLGEKLLGGGLCHFVSTGLTSITYKNDLVDDPVTYVREHSQQLKQKTTQFATDCSKIDKSIEDVRGKFKQSSYQQIKKCIANLNKTLLDQIKNLPCDEHSLTILINGAMKQDLCLPSTGSQQSKKLLEMFAKQFDKDDLAQKYLSKINLSVITDSCFKNICKQKNYASWIEIGLYQLIRQSLLSANIEKKEMIITEQAQLQNTYNNLINKQNSTPPEQFNKQVENFNTAQTKFNEKVDKYKRFCQTLNVKKIFQTIKQKKGIEKGRLKSAVIDSLPEHQFTKEALSNLKYVDSSKQFEQKLADVLFNVVGNFGLKIIEKMHLSSGGVKEKLDKIASMMSSQ